MLDTFVICSSIFTGSRSLHNKRKNNYSTDLINEVIQSGFKNKAIPDIRFGSGLCSLYELYFLYLIPSYKLVQSSMNGYSHTSEERFGCSCRESNRRGSSRNNRQLIRCDNKFVI